MDRDMTAHPTGCAASSNAVRRRVATKAIRSARRQTGDIGILREDLSRDAFALIMTLHRPSLPALLQDQSHVDFLWERRS
jgi:hypothetical protein